ncbi:hypothetical protein ACH4TP_11380 [Streptomyces sp. NPDC021012]|uniref:hypothetical protein n=1 Tax=Streptomyces sp. NPDC021012 TaxID=3365107 RepID=UPI0037921CF3
MTRLEGDPAGGGGLGGLVEVLRQALEDERAGAGAEHAAGWSVRAAEPVDEAGGGREAAGGQGGERGGDGDFVSENWGTPEQRDILTASPEGLAGIAFAEGSMKPKVDAAVRVARAGGRTLIGPLERLDDLMARRVGTEIRADVDGGVVYVGE